VRITIGMFVFNRPHHEIENDFRVWDRAALLIDSNLSETTVRVQTPSPSGSAMFGYLRRGFPGTNRCERSASSWQRTVTTRVSSDRKAPPGQKCIKCSKYKAYVRTCIVAERKSLVNIEWLGRKVLKKHGLRWAPDAISVLLPLSICC
jgi:hypothetical protein